jgi:hypothetical protein
MGGSDPVMVVPGAPEPMLAARGAVIVSPPTVTVKVMVVFGSPPALRSAAAACDTAAVLANAAAGASVAPITVPAASATTIDLRMVVLPRGPGLFRAAREAVYRPTRPRSTIGYASYTLANRK